MELTKEEYHELMQCIDHQLARLFINVKDYLRTMPENPILSKDMIPRFIKSAVANHDLLMTIKAKIDKEFEKK